MKDLALMLSKIGLTNAEAKAYLALLDLGQSTVGPIAKKANVSYSKIHALLEKLVDKGLASYSLKEKTKFFSPSNPKKIIDFLERKKQEINGLSSEALQMLPELQKKFGANPEGERIEVFEGIEGLSSIYNEGLDSLKEGEKVVVLGASFGIPSGRKKVSKFLEKINRKRISKKIHYRLIYNESLRDDAEVKEWKKLPLTEIRFLLDDTPASVNVAADRTMIIYWHQEKPKVFFIKSKPVAGSFRKYFEVIWEKAKE